MPYAFENRKRASLLPLPGVDARIRLTETDKAQIRARHAAGESIRAIARAYARRCSRRLVQFVCYPDRLEAAARARKLRGLDGRYYDRAKHADAMRRHRRRKQRLIKRERT